jgi:uncharacterized membrane protein YuzA (DUF378 family)
MKSIILSIFAAVTIALVPVVALSGVVYAACGNGADSKGQVLQGIGETGNNCNDNGVDNFITAVVRILSLIVGIAAIIVIILSGLKYITSAGDTAKITSAKNTLIYALIGLIVAAVAQFLVYFVFTASKNATKKSSLIELRLPEA